MNRWSDLLSKARKGDVTTAENKEIQQLIAESPLKERQYKETLDPLLIFREHPELLYIDSEKMWQKLKKQLIAKGMPWGEEDN